MHASITPSNPSIFLMPSNRQRQHSCVAHRYGISFVDLVLILHDARTSVETRSKTNSIANTLHTIIQVGKTDRSVRSVEVNLG
jgi:hypothetical protein